MRVLVTGGAGFIGGAVTSALLDAGHDVVVLDVMLAMAHGEGAAPDVDRRADFVRADVRDGAAVAAALHGVDAISHQAAMVGLGVDLGDLPDYAGINDLGTAVLLAAAARAGVRRLVLASSMVVYGEGRYLCVEHGAVRPGSRRESDLDAGLFEPPCPVCGRSLLPGLVEEDAQLDPRSVYAATKAAQEHLCSAWAIACGGRVSALRYHNVYGPRMPRDTPYAGVASLFRSALERGEPPRLYEDGGQRRDFVHVADVARANVRALELPDAPPGLRPYNVGSGTPHTVGELAGQLCSAFGAGPPVVTGHYRAGDVRHVTASCVRAQRELGHRSEVSFAQGVRQFATDPLRGPSGPSGPR